MVSLVAVDLLKIFLAILVGGLIGAEREFRHRAAGFRTLIFICLGATLFTMLSLKLGGEMSPVRIAAHMVTGVGFLCAGVVMEQGAHVVGLTTAATIWLSAALGVGIGGGEYALSIAATLVALLVLWGFPRLEDWIYNFREGRTYQVKFNIDTGKPEQLEALIQENKLQIKNHTITKSGKEMVCTMEIYGSPEGHEQLTNALIEDHEIIEFKF